MSRFDATRTTEVPENAWTVPNEREGNVIYQHSVWNVDYSKIDAVIIDGVRFERRSSKHDD